MNIIFSHLVASKERFKLKTQVVIILKYIFIVPGASNNTMYNG